MCVCARALLRWNVKPRKQGPTSSSNLQAPTKGRGKQKGPLPMTIAQLVVLGIFGGIGYAFTAKQEQSANLVQAAVDLLIRYVPKPWLSVSVLKSDAAACMAAKPCIASALTSSLP